MKDIIKHAMSLENEGVELNQPAQQARTNELPIVTIAKNTDTGQAAVVVDGPLGVVIGKALNVAYAVHNPLNSEAGQAGVTPAMETQVNDIIRDAAMVRKSEKNDIIDLIMPDDNKIGYISGGTSLKSEFIKQVPTEVFTQLRNYDAPEDFILVVDNTGPNDQAPAGGGDRNHFDTNFKVVEYGGSYAVESYAIVVKLKKL